MTTPEQQAREMLERMGVEGAQRMSAGELVELANLIAEHDALKAEFKIIDEMNDQLREQNEAVGEACAKLEAELAAIKGAGEPVGHVYTMEPCIPGEHVRYHAQMTAKVPAGTKLYTRPCVPLTDEQIVLIRDEHLPSQGDSFDCVAFARAVIEAHIKGAQG